MILIDLDDNKVNNGLRIVRNLEIRRWNKMEIRLFCSKRIVYD